MRLYCCVYESELLCVEGAIRSRLFCELYLRSNVS